MRNKMNNLLNRLGFTITVFTLAITAGYKLDFVSILKSYTENQGVLTQEVGSISNLPSEVIPGGDLIGVKILSDGIYVVGTSEVETPEGDENPCKHKIFKGDRIYAINDQEIHSKDELKAVIEKNTLDELVVTLKRDGLEQDVTIKPVYSKEEQAYKLGLWVKDGVQGIGTVTYINPQDMQFGALGHGINDSDLKGLIPIKKGEITPTEITTITKGQKGDPGQLGGEIDYTQEKIMGEVHTNTSIGIYGKLNQKGLDELSQKTIEVGQQSEIEEGPAILLSSLIDNEVKSYHIMIEKVSQYNTEPAKGMVIKIVDDKLLEVTNGIVQGMSGSPIIQDGKLVGAVTHVFVNDPTRGYGIFIENMLKKAIKQE